MKLYGMGIARSARCEWTLRELGFEAEIIAVNLRAGDHLKPEFLAVNPYGKIPALQDGDLTLVESAAICLHLAEKAPEKGLIPAVGTPERALFYQWVFTTVTDLEQPIWRATKHSMLYPEAKRLAADIELARAEFNKMAKVAEGMVGARHFVVGDQFTVADILLAYTLDWSSVFGWLEEFPGLKAYAERHYQRPSAPMGMKEYFAANR